MSIKDRQIMMASRSSARSKPGLSLIEDEYWYAGPLSERKAEIILTKLGESGCFLVRDSLLPEADYVLSVNSGKDIWHYDIQVLPSNECIFNKYTFTSLPDAVMFYTENRLGSVFLKEPEEPVVSEAQLKSFGPSVIKSVAPSSTKPPRTSPFVSAESATTTTLTSSPQTRRLVAPESLSPCTPPATSAKSHHTSSPQTRMLAAPESIKPPHRMQFVSEDTHANASPQLQCGEPEPDREVMSDTINLNTLSALPRSTGLVGEGWLETHSGAGSQVSLGSHSPKPQSVQRFIVDLEESAGTSQISSQTSEVDCSYIAPSKEVESVYITSGYMYVVPRSSDFDSTSPNGENKDKQTFKGQYSPKLERDEDGTKADICETQFDSSGVPTTAILDTPSSAESTPVRHVGSLATEHTTAKNGQEYALPNKSSPNLAKVDNFQEKEKVDENIKDDQVSRKSSNGNSEPQEIDQLPSIANRRLAFEQQAQNSKESNRNSAAKPAKRPPAVPKRVSSISSMQKQENGLVEGDQNAPNPVEITVASSGPHQEENGAEVMAEEMPPPPPMSTHPGVISKKPVVTEPVHNELQQEEQENEQVREEKAEIEVEQEQEDESVREEKAETEVEQEQEDEPVRELEMPKSAVELRDTSKLRPVPKERRISVSAVKPIEPEAEQDSNTEPSSDVKPTPVIGPSTETSTMSNQSPQDEIDETAEDDRVTSTSTFGHTASSAKPNLPTVAITSEQSTHEERTALDDIDPSKKIGAEVSTFKPIPKPRSTHRLSAAAFDSSTEPSISVTQDEAPPPKLRTAPHSLPPTYTPEMKRSSAYYPAPVNREFLLRAQSMSMLPTTGSASPRMVARGEQRQQMPPGFVVFSRSQEAVVGRTATLTSSMMRRTIQIDSGNKKGDGELTASAPPPTAAPMNTKRGPTKKRRSLFRRK